MSTATSTTIKVDIGKNATDAAASATSLATQLYECLPTGDARGQAFKNEFTRTFLARSNRAKQMAQEVLGTGKAKSVDGEDAEDDEEDSSDVCPECGKPSCCN